MSDVIMTDYPSVPFKYRGVKYKLNKQVSDENYSSIPNNDSISESGMKGSAISLDN